MDPGRLEEANKLLAKYEAARRKRGRPTRYSEALGRALCKLLASGMSLNAICKRPGMPHKRRVLAWAQDPQHPFSAPYQAARMVGWFGMGEDIIDIADDSSGDWETRYKLNGEEYHTLRSDHVRRSELRVKTRMWALERMLPKIYGNKLETTVRHDVAEQFVAFMRDRVTPRQAPPALKVHKGGKYGA